MIKREIRLPDQKSLMLFGPRQTGKTTLVRSVYPGAKTYNLLLSDVYTRLVARPHLWREEILALGTEIKSVFVDEVQRIPELLNEIQYLMDSGIDKQFILTGSSARKLKRGQSNLLAGRAWSFNLYPLTLNEMGAQFDLCSVMTHGTLPGNVVSTDDNEKSENLRAYVNVYLKEEIEAEALSRNIGGFIRFLATAAQSNGEQINYSNIARDVGLSSVTVKEYYKILEDTLIGSFLLPFSYSERKKHKTSPKFYFFDPGVLRAMQNRLNIKIERQTFEFGNYFETWVINECMRISSYERKDLRFSFLRTANNVEVDLVIETPQGKILAVEIKGKDDPTGLDFENGFLALKKLTPKPRCICVCPASSPRLVGECEVLPYRMFFDLIRSL